MLLAHTGGPAAASAGTALLTLGALAAATYAGARMGLAPRGARPVPAVLSGCLLVVTAVLVTAPAALHAASEAGVPWLLLLLLAGAALVGASALARRSCGRLGVVGLVLHRLLEGAAVTAGAASGLQTGLVVLGAVAIHGACEGLVLTSYLSALGQQRRTMLAAVGVLVAAPLAGGLLAGFGAVPPVALPVLLALLTGLLLSMAATVLTPRPAAACGGRPPRPGHHPVQASGSPPVRAMTPIARS